MLNFYFTKYKRHKLTNKCITYIFINIIYVACIGTRLSTILIVLNGVFDGKVKLIKKTQLGSSVVAWDTENSNTWGTATLNTEMLNDTYLKGLGDYTNMIAETTWKVGGNTPALIRKTAGVKNVYNAEIVNPDRTNSTDGKTEDTFKVGLMYASDYMYAADPTIANSWSSLMGENSDETKDFRAVTGTNWMFSGSAEWTITRNSSTSNLVFLVTPSGYLGLANANGGSAIRPSFYLDDLVTYAGGIGTKEQPYRLGA